MVFNKSSHLTSDRPIYDEFYDGYRLFIGDLTDRIISSDVYREFSRFGELIDVWVARNPSGFGFAVFQNKVDCMRCQRKLNGRAIFDRALRVDFARPTPIFDSCKAPASYQAYITKLKDRGIEPKYKTSYSSRNFDRRPRYAQKTVPYYEFNHRKPSSFDETKKSEVEDTRHSSAESHRRRRHRHVSKDGKHRRHHKSEKRHHSDDYEDNNSEYEERNRKLFKSNHNRSPRNEKKRCNESNSNVESEEGRISSSESSDSSGQSEISD